MVIIKFPREADMRQVGWIINKAFSADKLALKDARKFLSLFFPLTIYAFSDIVCLTMCHLYVPKLFELLEQVICLYERREILYVIFS